ncbi:hypothetical protein M9H77_26053 [Catharanthus roseus]|uniref:Uncharacterized protein n=1 Tax=Catharanthus roseus TaxID=4058 RepID=A0ACC0AAF5_CATRO|nr:hypothetical protein M9H77_26053 [Catharanthus roseus]
MGLKLGEEVGYTIRFEDISDTVRSFVFVYVEECGLLIAQDLTRIKFLTNGVLLREMMDDPLLSKYSVIMVDEAHERSLSTDISLGLRKRHVISCELTLFMAKPSKRRHGPAENMEQGPSTEAAILSVEGRGSNVEVFYLEDPPPDYLQTTVSTVLSIHDQEPMGDNLVFLMGQDDIDVAVQLLSEEAHNSRYQGLIVSPLYSGLPRADQGIVYVVDIDSLSNGSTTRYFVLSAFLVGIQEDYDIIFYRKITNRSLPYP